MRITNNLSILGSFPRTRVTILPSAWSGRLQPPRPATIKTPERTLTMASNSLERFRQSAKAEPGTWLFFAAVLLLVVGIAALFIAVMVT